MHRFAAAAPIIGPEEESSHDRGSYGKCPDNENWVSPVNQPPKLARRVANWVTLYVTFMIQKISMLCGIENKDSICHLLRTVFGRQDDLKQATIFSLVASTSTLWKLSVDT